MAKYYLFERNDGATLTDTIAKKIVEDAGYDGNQFTYSEDDKKVKVTPTGPNSPYLPPPTIEHASRTKTGKPITVTAVD